MREIIWEVFGKPWKGCCHSKSIGKALKSLSSSVSRSDGCFQKSQADGRIDFKEEMGRAARSSLEGLGSWWKQHECDLD